jgi:hypothetical protein
MQLSGFSDDLTSTTFKVLSERRVERIFIKLSET